MLSIIATFSDYWDLLSRVDAAQIKALAASNMGLALVVCFFSGVLTSLTPCVYPMIPITINIFGRMAQHRASRNAFGFNPYSFRMACIYVGGMCTTYSIMGLIAGMTGSVFGTLLQSAWMLAFLCVLFLTLSLGQLGLFKIQLPVALQSRLAGAGRVQNAFGVFLMGLVSGLVVSPCVGPVIAGILAFVFDSSNALTGLLYFLSFSLGLGVLFLLIGGFSGLVNRIPRSGTWMVRVNWCLASLLLIASAYYGFLCAKRLGFWVPPSSASETTSETLGNLRWSTEELPVPGRARIIDFTAEWCEACHVINRTVFGDSRVIERLKQFDLVRIDMTSSTEKADEIARRYGVMGLPAVVIVDGAGIVSPHRVTGVVTPEDFLGLLERAVPQPRP